MHLLSLKPHRVYLASRILSNVREFPFGWIFKVRIEGLWFANGNRVINKNNPVVS